jgi:hypothetical protein
MFPDHHVSKLYHLNYQLKTNCSNANAVAYSVKALATTKKGFDKVFQVTFKLAPFFKLTSQKQSIQR